jgi:hypothetical protein
LESAAPATHDEAWLARAIERYHALCAQPALGGPGVAAAFASEQRQRGLTFGGTVQCRSLRPAFITAATLEALRDAVRQFSQLIRVVEQRALEDRSFATYLGLSDREQQLITIDPGYDGATVVSRLDMFYGGWPTIIEYKSDRPCGGTARRRHAARNARRRLARVRRPQGLGRAPVALGGDRRSGRCRDEHRIHARAQRFRIARHSDRHRYP